MRGLLLALCLLSAAAQAQEELEPGELGRSAIPILGYDDNSGWLFGGAGFLYTDKEPGINAGLFVVSNFNAFHSATLNVDQRGAGPWSYALHLLGERAFEYYYGEGDLTPTLDARLIRLVRFEVKPAFLYRVAPHLRLGAMADFRSRYEQESAVFPNEASTAWGLQAQWDSRDKLINTRRGNYALLEWSQNPAAGAFYLLKADLRHFRRLRPGLVHAGRLVAGTSLGGPSYAFRYQLGGLDYLRGYKQNRFRGREFFLIQQELRWVLLKWLSINASVDSGGIRDDAYHQLKVTGQLGLRLGLPPGFGQKMRVDLGVGADQITMQVQFGEIF